MRRRHRLSQRAVADGMAVSSAMLCWLEYGKRSLTTAIAARLVKFYAGHGIDVRDEVVEVLMAQMDEGR